MFRYTLILGIAALCCACSDSPRFIGSWMTSAPTHYNAPMPKNSTVNFITGIDFLPGEEHTSGPLVLTSLIDISQQLPADSLIIAEPYDVSVAASTSLNGTWTLMDDDEIAIAVDFNTLQVNIDHNGVTFSQNILTRANAATVDSLAQVSINYWKGEIIRAWTYELTRMQYLEDVEVSPDRNMLTFEVKNTGNFDIKLAYQRVINAD
ncbi:MAG: hypothetical protein ACI4AM_03875 [Muribaculaceae bacterium]